MQGDTRQQNEYFDRAMATAPATIEAAVGIAAAATEVDPNGDTFLAVMVAGKPGIQRKRSSGGTDTILLKTDPMILGWGGQ